MRMFFGIDPIFFPFLPHNRDFSSACTSTQQFDMLSVLFHPHGFMDFALSNHHNSQTIRRLPGTGRQYKKVFHNLEQPKYTTDELYTQQELDDLADCRFYIAMKAPSGFCWKAEIVDAGRVYSLDREIPPFPTLSEIIRLQLHRGLESDSFCKTKELIFGSTRSEFLQNILYPEISTQLDLLITKFKLSTQLHIAKQELDHRNNTTTSDKPTDFPHTSYSEMSNDELSAWIEDTSSFVNNRKFNLSPTRPKLTTADALFSIPVNHNSAFRYSFVKHDNRTALPTAFLIAKAKNFRRHGSYLSVTTQLAERCPHKVSPISSPNESHLENIETVRYFLHFLSFGFFDALKYT